MGVLLPLQGLLVGPEPASAVLTTLPCRALSEPPFLVCTLPGAGGRPHAQHGACAVSQIHSHTRGCHSDRSLGHLSVTETELLRDPEGGRQVRLVGPRWVWPKVRRGLGVWHTQAVDRLWAVGGRQAHHLACMGDGRNLCPSLRPGLPVPPRVCVWLVRSGPQGEHRHQAAGSQPWWWRRDAGMKEDAQGLG